MNTSKVEFVARQHPNPHAADPRARVKKSADKSYIVVVDGVEVGIVEQRMATMERAIPGKRYVASRWQSPRWYIDRLPGKSVSGERHRIYFETRGKAAEHLIAIVAAVPNP